MLIEAVRSSTAYATLKPKVRELLDAMLDAYVDPGEPDGWACWQCTWREAGELVGVSASAARERIRAMAGVVQSFRDFESENQGRLFVVWPREDCRVPSGGPGGLFT